MFRRFLIFSIFILSYFPTITKASDYSPIIFEENHIDISNFDARWEPYSKKWGMELDTIRSLFAGEEFFLVPCIRSQDDFKTYFEIRNNQNGDLEHIKFYEDGKRKTEGECKITYDRRCSNMGRDMGLNLLIVTKIPGQGEGEYVSPAWIVVSRLKNFPKVAEVAYIKSGEWKYRDGLVSKALGKVVSAIGELTARNVYDIECIYATVHPENIKSINLLLRNGFYADDSLVVEMADGPRKIFHKRINGNNLRN